MAERRFGVSTILGILLMVFGGGCAFLFSGFEKSMGSSSGVSNEVLLIGGIPIILGIALVLLDLRGR